MNTSASLRHFAYQAAGADGRVVRGSVAAQDLAEARLRLKEQQLYPLKLREMDQGPAVSGRGAARWVTFFTAHLADLLESGLQVDRALATLARLTPARWLPLLTSLRAEVQGGASLADALARHPALFSSSYLGLVRAGEASGNLEPVLHRLAANREEEEEVRQFVRTAFTYPTIVAGASLLAGGFMVGFVVPRFAALYRQFGTALPWPTRLVLGLQRSLALAWPLWLALLLGLPLVGWLVFGRSPELRERVGRLAAGVPGVAAVARELAAARLARTLAMLLGSGLTLSRALGVLTESEAAPGQRRRLAAVKAAVENGRSLSAALAEQRLLPVLAVEVVAVGEETATLEAAFTRVAHLYGNSAKEGTRRLLSLLEPLLILAVAGLVGLVMAAVLLPVLAMPSFGL